MWWNFLWRTYFVLKSARKFDMMLHHWKFARAKPLPHSGCGLQEY
jgi:hypothetical protein